MNRAGSVVDQFLQFLHLRALHGRQQILRATIQRMARMNPDPQAIVTEFARVTKPGGLVCLMEPGGKRLWRGHDDVTHTARRFSLPFGLSVIAIGRKRAG